MNFQPIREEALQLIWSGGYWSPVSGETTFNSDPLVAEILWHDHERISTSTAFCLLRVTELMK